MLQLNYYSIMVYFIYFILPKISSHLKILLSLFYRLINIMKLLHFLIIHKILVLNFYLFNFYQPNLSINQIIIIAKILVMLSPIHYEIIYQIPINNLFYLYLLLFLLIVLLILLHHIIIPNYNQTLMVPYLLHLYILKYIY